MKNVMSFLALALGALLIPVGVLGILVGLVFGAMFLGTRGVPNLRVSEDLYQFLCLVALILLGTLLAGMGWLIHRWHDHRLEKTDDALPMPCPPGSAK